MKLFELLNAYRAMESLKVTIVPGEDNQPVQVIPAKLPAKLTYAVVKNERLMEADLKAHDAGYLAILEKAGIKEGEKIPNEKQAEMDAEYQELVNSELTLEVYKIKLELLDGVTLDAGQMNALFWMVEE